MTGQKRHLWSALNHFGKKCGAAMLCRRRRPCLYIEMIPHFLRKQCFHIKCVLFRECNLYGINSISVIDGSLWIHLQESKFSAYDKMWIIRKYPHSLRTQSFSLDDTLTLYFFASTVLDRLSICLVVLQPSSSKHGRLHFLRN